MAVTRVVDASVERGLHAWLEQASDCHLSYLILTGVNKIYFHDLFCNFGFSVDIIIITILCTNYLNFINIKNWILFFYPKNTKKDAVIL